MVFIQIHISHKPQSQCHSVCCVLCTVTNVTAHCYVSIMVYYATRQQIKYNGAQLKHRYKTYVLICCFYVLFYGEKKLIYAHDQAIAFDADVTTVGSYRN